MKYLIILLGLAACNPAPNKVSKAPKIHTKGGPISWEVVRLEQECNTIKLQGIVRATEMVNRSINMDVYKHLVHK